MDAPLTPEALRVLRVGLGLTLDQMAQLLGLTGNDRVRYMRRIEIGAEKLSPRRVAIALDLEAHAAETVADYIQTLTDEVDPVFTVTDNPDEMPLGWQRMIAFRVRQAIPTLHIAEDPHE